ncbi:MAG: hypothetical protein GY765_35380, partial [bacterium]|nr:hypothetical protein [bacterium]
TVYTAELPRASRHWSRLRLEAEGVFQRTVGFEKPGKGHKKWKTWRNVSWWNKDAEKAFLWTDMTGFPKDGKKIRFSIHHGDNQPMELKGLVVYYPSISVCFIAHEVGLYVLMGGNPGILPPSYDLSMIRSSLLQLMPEETVMGVVEPLEVKGKSPFADILNSNWGLYLIFGLVALVLIVVIVRLFPKPEK